MEERIGIIGMGETEYRRENPNSLEELVHNAGRAALEDASVDRSDIENVAVCASDLEDGRAISSMVTAGPVGGYRKDFIKTTDTGIHAVGLAAMRMAAGVFDTTLVASWAKHSETDEEAIRRLEADPQYRRGTGLGHITGHAMHASVYASKTPESTEAARAAVQRNTTNAAGADGSPGDGPTSTEAVDDSPVVSWPVREGHLPDPCDGACALVLATESAADRLNAEPVWLDGVGWEAAGYDGSTASLGRLDAAYGAADRAYQEASIEDPGTEIDAVELHSKTAFHEHMVAEALGLADNAAAAELNGQFDPGGAVTVNPSGGPYAGNPLIATGLARVAAAARQVRTDDAETAIAHATSGFTDQSHGVAVLRGGSS